MKLSKKTEASIIKDVNEIADAYDVYRNLSYKLDKRLQKHVLKAIDNKDTDLLNSLIDLTCPMSKTGASRASGDFVGRFYLFLAVTELNAEKEKKKKKK